MSKKLTQPGNTRYARLLAVLAGLLFVHGVSTSLLLKFSSCAPLSRIIDILLIGLGLLLVAGVPMKQTSKRLVATIWRNPALRLFSLLLLGYSCWILARGAQAGASLRETLLALAVDTALFWVFLLFTSVYSATQSDRDASLRLVVQVLGVMSLLAVGLYFFGIHDQLDSWLGYGTCSTEATLRTAGVSGWLRTRGFVRNPNELGAMLIVPLMISIGWIITNRVKLTIKKTILVSGFVALLLVTFSRSAWIGACIGLGLILITSHEARDFAVKQRRFFLLLTALLLVLVSVVVNSSKFVNEVILHKSEGSNSTAQHLVFKKEGLEHLSDNAWGTGPGSAGAVGAALKDGPSIQTESAYLDIGAQYGWIGLATSLGLFLIMALLLLKSSSVYASFVAAGFVGLLVSGLFIPVWSNLTVTILVGLLAGLAVSHPKHTRP